MAASTLHGLPFLKNQRHTWQGRLVTRLELDEYSSTSPGPATGAAGTAPAGSPVEGQAPAEPDHHRSPETLLGYVLWHDPTVPDTAKTSGSSCCPQ